MASNAITRAYKPYLKELGVTYPQYVILMALWEEDNISIRTIQERTLIDAGSLTQILGKLKAKGIVSISVSSEDKRRKFVILTRAGRELKEEAVNIPEKMKCKLKNLNSDEAILLITLVDKLNQDLMESDEQCNYGL